MNCYSLVNAHEKAKEYPDTFEIPDIESIMALAIGDFVKLAFIPEDGAMTERIWVQLKLKLEDDKFIGILANDPVSSSIGMMGNPVVFKTENILSTMTAIEMHPQ